MNSRIADELEHGWTKVWDVSIASDPLLGVELIKQILDELEQLNWDQGELFGVHMSLEEAIMNAIKHGNGLCENKQVVINARISPTKFYVRVEDEGPGFDPTAVPDPTLDENLTKPSGRGLMLMRIYMTCVEFNSTGNQIELLKVRQI